MRDRITSYRGGWVWWGGGGIVCTSLCIVVSVSLVGTYKLNVHNHHSVGSVSPLGEGEGMDIVCVFLCVFLYLSL